MGPPPLAHPQSTQADLTEHLSRSRPWICVQSCTQSGFYEAGPLVPILWARKLRLTQKGFIQNCGVHGCGASSRPSSES